MTIPEAASPREAPSREAIEEELADLFASGTVQLWRKVRVELCTSIILAEPAFACFRCDMIDMHAVCRRPRRRDGLAMIGV